MKVIGLVGQRLSGKNAFANHLHRKYGFSVLDFTKNLLAPLLRDAGRSVTRENLTRLAMSLREKHGTDVLARRLFERVGRGNCVITGVRFPEEVECFRRKFGRGFVLVGVECGPRIRYGRISRKRTKESRGMTYEDFLMKEELPTERVIPKTMKLAKFRVTNEGTKKDLYAKIDKLMKEII
jgi:dephospho-CoA kinase